LAIRPASEYTHPSNRMVVVTPYFNPAQFASRRKNFEIFLEPFLAGGFQPVIIECAFGHSDFEIPLDRSPIRVRARDFLWQKERLINIAFTQLPARCSFVAWVDGDILFENPNWAIEAEAALDSSTGVVQLFDVCYWLPEQHTFYAGSGSSLPSFGARYLVEGRRTVHMPYQHHGHTGFAWAARREIVADHGLYDACITGSGDHVMAHVFAGDWSSKCFSQTLGNSRKCIDHAAHWADKVHCRLRGQLGAVPGAVLHLWHGEERHRMYVERRGMLIELGFDPRTDLVLERNGTWAWGANLPLLSDGMRQYFYTRREDG
jgi:hypothetical protein